MVNRSIAECCLVDLAWFCIEWTRYLKRTFFNQYCRKYIKLLSITWLVTYNVYSLVPLVIADHRLAQSMPWRYCKMLFYYCAVIICNLGVTDTLPSVHHLIRRWYTVFAHMMLNFGTVFVTLLSTGRSRVINKFSSRSQSKTSWPSMKWTISLHNAHICHSPQQSSIPAL